MLKTITNFSLAALVSLLLGSCVHPSGESVSVDTKDTGVSLAGAGVEIDPHFFSQNLSRQDGATESDWYNIVVPRVKTMGIQRFRVMLQPHWWEPYKGVYTMDSPEVVSLCKVLDLAQECGIDVVLVSWGCPIHAFGLDPEVGVIGKHFTAGEGTNWVTKCADADEFAENFVYLVKWLIREKGYSCIKELTPYNEPDGNVSPLDEYYECCRALDVCLRKEGLRDTVKLNLSDNTDCRRWYLKGCTRNIADITDLFNSHTYIFGYENPNSDALKWEKKNVSLAAAAGKPHIVGEFGSNQCVGSTRQKDINLYERGVLICRNAINFLNGGAAGFSYWTLFDQYYGRDADYGQMMILGLWRYKQNAYLPEDLAEGIEGDYAVRPQYFAYSMFTRFVRKGDRVHPVNMHDRFVAGTAVVSPDGKWTYLFANGSDSDHKYSLSNPLAGDTDSCSLYIYHKDALPDGDAMIEPSAEVNPQDGRLTFDLPSQSVVVLRQK